MIKLHETLYPEYAKYYSDLYKAVRSGDLNTFKDFLRKHGRFIPDNDTVIEISMYKILYNNPYSTKEEKARAEEWLHDRGYNTTI